VQKCAQARTDRRDLPRFKLKFRSHNGNVSLPAFDFAAMIVNAMSQSLLRERIVVRSTRVFEHRRNFLCNFLMPSGLSADVSARFSFRPAVANFCFPFPALEQVASSI